jgi:hypothetical protein
MTTGVDRFRPTAMTLVFRPGQYIQFGSMGEKADISITLRALSRRFQPQTTRTASLAKVVTQPAAGATAVFGPDVSGQANKNE